MNECHHGRSWFRRELSHMRDHWFSCLLGCVIVHLVMDGISALFEAIK